VVLLLEIWKQGNVGDELETNHLLVIILVIQILTCVSIFILIGNLDSAIIDLKKFCYNFTSSTSKGDITSPQIIIPANNSTDINIKILGG
jgi:hypothetical protein